MVEIYCDGGCRNNQDRENIGGYGVVIKLENAVMEFNSKTLNTTNNKEELKACIAALGVIQADEEIILTTDSNYVVQGMNKWLAGWKNKNWKKADKKPVLNKELWVELDTLASNRDVKFIHCYGHSDNEGNIRADELANMAMDDIIVNIVVPS